MTSIGQKNVTQQMSSWKSPYRLISACNPRSASNSSTSRYESEKRKYQPTARTITSGSNWRHLNRPQTEDARRSILPAYHGVTAKLQHFRRAVTLRFTNKLDFVGISAID